MRFQRRKKGKRREFDFGEGIFFGEEEMRSRYENFKKRKEEKGLKENRPRYPVDPLFR